MEYYRCRTCHERHHVIWREVIEKVFHCEKFQKTAEYVSELLAKDGRTLSSDPKSRGHSLIYNAFAIETTDKLQVLRIVRWWSFLYHSARQRGAGLCVRDMMNNVIAAEIAISFPAYYDESRVLLSTSSFGMLHNTYVLFKPTGTKCKTTKNYRNFSIIPSQFVIERNLPLMFSSPSEHNTIRHILPVQIKYNPTGLQRRSWIQSMFNFIQKWMPFGSAIKASDFFKDVYVDL